MAIVKANYVKRGKGDKARAKATVRYITHRRDRDNRAATRDLMGFDGVLTKEQAYQMIDQAKRETIFYRLVISPDSAREDKYKDLSLADIVTNTILALEERLGKQVEFVYTEHNDHSPHRHTHLLVFVHGRRLTKEDFQALRQEATHQALFQRRMRDLTLARHREAACVRSRGSRQIHQTTRSPAPSVPVYSRRFQEQPHSGQIRSPFASYSCPVCGFHLVAPNTNRMFANPKRCPYCGIKMRRDRNTLTRNLTPGREAG